MLSTGHWYWPRLLLTSRSAQYNCRWHQQPPSMFHHLCEVQPHVNFNQFSTLSTPALTVAIHHPPTHSVHFQHLLEITSIHCSHTRCLVHTQRAAWWWRRRRWWWWWWWRLTMRNMNCKYGHLLARLSIALTLTAVPNWLLAMHWYSPSWCDWTSSISIVIVPLPGRWLIPASASTSSTWPFFNHEYLYCITSSLRQQRPVRPGLPRAVFRVNATVDVIQQ